MKNLQYLLFFFSSFCLYACKKSFLDVENTQFLYRQNYVKDLGTMQEFLNGIYIILGRDLEHGNAAAYPELIADNIRPLNSSGTVMIPHYSWTQQADENDVQVIVGADPSTTAMNPLWKTGYLAIRACSFVIEDVDKYRDENPLKADDMRGQAQAIRALLHFRLVNVFAQPYVFTSGASHLGVPYITTSDITKPYSRQAVSEVYASMIADLNSAIQLLPEGTTDVRLMNRTAAKALLARVYLFKEDFINAKALALEISSKVPLMTIANGYPAELFKLKLPSQTETMFQLIPKSGGLPSYNTNFIGRYFRISPIRFVATSDIANILREYNGDVRRNWISGPNNIIKFPSGVSSDVTPAEGSYFPAIIRSSEMFLTVAEASAKTGDENTARMYLDSVRKRANPAIVSVTATGPALLDSIYKERRKELAFESLRMYDLQRWKLGVHRVDFLFNYAKDLDYPNNKAIAPIPARDVILAGIIQNPGY